MPDPKAILQKISRILTDSSEINVFWICETNQVVFCIIQMTGNSTWFIQNNKNIMESLSCVLPWKKFVASKFSLFENQTEHSSDHLITEIYDCSWSDFGYDGLILHMEIQEVSELRKNTSDEKSDTIDGSSEETHTCSCKDPMVVRSTDIDRNPQVTKHCIRSSCKLPLSSSKHSELLLVWQEKVLDCFQVNCCALNRPIQTNANGQIRCLHCWTSLRT
jgi:hypothetical protein